MSHGGPTAAGSPSICSGAMNAGVPRMAPVFVSLASEGSSRRAILKIHDHGLTRAVIITLEGLRSL